jgi:alpha-galactosidase/6-phospho-beta-glucosidase family protein
MLPSWLDVKLFSLAITTSSFNYYVQTEWEQKTRRKEEEEKGNERKKKERKKPGRQKKETNKKNRETDPKRCKAKIRTHNYTNHAAT